MTERALLMDILLLLFLKHLLNLYYFNLRLNESEYFISLKSQKVLKKFTRAENLISKMFPNIV